MYAFNSAAIFSPGHPYIESTTVLSDDERDSNTKRLLTAVKRAPAGWRRASKHTSAVIRRNRLHLGIRGNIPDLVYGSDVVVCARCSSINCSNCFC